MIEVLQESIRLPNLPFTALLGVVVCYWLMVAVGFFSFDGGAGAHGDAGGDVHVDGHAEADVHADGDAHADSHGHGHVDAPHAHHAGGVFSHLLHFVNVGEVPVMIVLSVLALWMWLFSMMANHYFTGGSLLWALAFVVPNLVLSAVITRYATWPMKKLFGALNREYDEHTPIIGRTCQVMTSEVTGEFGQAQIDRTGAPLLINVRTSDGPPLCKGETGLVVREDREKNIFYVVKVTPDKLKN